MTLINNNRGSVECSTTWNAPSVRLRGPRRGFSVTFSAYGWRGATSCALRVGFRDWLERCARLLPTDPCCWGRLVVPGKPAPPTTTMMELYLSQLILEQDVSSIHQGVFSFFDSQTLHHTQVFKKKLGEVCLSSFSIFFTWEI